MHAFLRQELATLMGKDFANSVRILYGGSVSLITRAASWAAKTSMEAFVGGASLKVQDFLGIIKEGI